MDSKLIFEPEERGSKVVIRRMAPHYKGLGEVIARRVALTDAQAIARAVNAHDELVEALTAARQCVQVYITKYDFTKGNEILARVDAALAKVSP